MLYTVGPEKSYRARIKIFGLIKKLGRYDAADAGHEGYMGGCVFQKIDDAHRYIYKFFPGEEDKYGVFGLESATEWENDTEPSEDGWWHYLLVSRRIILLQTASQLSLLSGGLPDFSFKKANDG